MKCLLYLATVAETYEFPFFLCFNIRSSNTIFSLDVFIAWLIYKTVGILHVNEYFTQLLWLSRTNKRRFKIIFVDIKKAATRMLRQVNLHSKLFSVLKHSLWFAMLKIVLKHDKLFGSVSQTYVCKPNFYRLCFKLLLLLAKEVIRM